MTANTQETIAVRQYRPEDHATVTKILVEGLAMVDNNLEFRYLWEERIREDLSIFADIEASHMASGGNLLVATVTKDGSSKVVGMTGLQRTSEAVGEVRRVFVDPKCHRMGVGRKLLAHLERWSKEQGIEKLTLTTSAKDQKPQAFYTALGYTKVDETLYAWNKNPTYFELSSHVDHVLSQTPRETSTLVNVATEPQECSSTLQRISFEDYISRQRNPIHAAGWECLTVLFNDLATHAGRLIAAIYRSRDRESRVSCTADGTLDLLLLTRSAVVTGVRRDCPSSLHLPLRSFIFRHCKRHAGRSRTVSGTETEYDAASISTTASSSSASPPPPSSVALTPARRSIGDSLPRRSLLVPEEVRPSSDEYARGRDSDERKSDDEPENEKPRDGRPRKKRRSRILSELRPVEGPESALPSVPAIDDDDSPDTDDPLQATDSGARAKEAFAAQRVRMRKSWCPDLRIYMKNAHPLFGICAAHRHHPYKRGDRFLVLFVALLVAVLLCGLFAIRDCCTEVLDVPVAVVNRRLEITAQEIRTPAYFVESEAPPSRLRGGRRAVAVASTYGLGETVAEDVECLPFYADCSVVSSVCAEGSTCRSGTDNNEAQCAPDEVPQKCVAGSCPTGWTCSTNTNSCTPTANYVCYLPAAEEERTAVNLAADSDGTFTAIEAIFQILQIAANKHDAEMKRNNSPASTSEDDTAQQSQSTTSSPSTPSISSSGSAATSTTSSSNASEPASSSTSSSSSQEIDTSSSNSTSESASGSVASESATVKVTLTEPVNGAVYSLSSTMVIEWHLTLISGIDPRLQNFRVEFSADNGDFDTIAANVSSSSSSVSSDDISVFQFEWELADNISWVCTTCVLRICALDVESATDDSLCIRSDGQSVRDGSRRRLQTTTVEGSSSSDVTFCIVREALECSCGMGHTSFILAAVVIGVCIPVVVLVTEPLVTFYRDRQVFGLFTRRAGPVRPVIAGYDASSATRKGRVVLVVVLLALCVACGFVAAQITTTNFLTEKGAIVVLWVVTFAIAAVLGVLVYCTLVGFVIFNFRWWRERARDRREPSGLSAYRSSLLSSDVNANNESIMSPP